MNKRKILYKKPHEEIDKIITSIDMDNLKKGIKGDIQFLSIGGSGYHLIVSKDLNREELLYNVTVGIKTSEGIQYKDVFGNLFIVKLDFKGEIIDLTEKDIFNLTKGFFFKRKE